MAVRRRRQRRVGVSYRVVTQRVRVHSAAIIAASDIEVGAIADAEWSARSKRQVQHVRPAGPIVQFIVVNRDARGRVAAGCNDAESTPGATIEPQPGHQHAGPSAPTIRNRVVNLCGRGGRGEWSPATEQVEFPLEHGAARPSDRRGHHGAGGPGVSGNIVDVQRVQLGGTAIAAGNVELPVDHTEPRQKQRRRQRRTRCPAVGGNVVDAQRVDCSGAIVTASYVDLPIEIPGGMIGQPGGLRYGRARSPYVSGYVVDAGSRRLAAEGKSSDVIDLARARGTRGRRCYRW